MERLSRRSAVRAIFLGGGAAVASRLLVACGGSPSSSSATSGAPTPAPAQSAPTPIPASQPSSGTSSSAPTVVPATTPAGNEEGAPPPDVVAKPPKSKEPIQLRFHMRTGGDKSEPAIYVYRPDEWAKATGNTYKLEPIPGGKDYIPKIEALAASGTIGDVLFDSEVHSEHSQLVKFKVLEPSDAFMKTYKISKDEWFPAITDSLTYDGQFYGMPKTGHPGDSYIWVNLKMFQEAGLPEPPEYGVTFDQIREWANKLSKGPKDSRDVYGFYSGVSGIQAITNGVRQFGGDILNKDGTASTVDQQGFSDWLTWNHQLLVVDKVHPFSQAIPNGDFAAIFAAEKLAMVHNQRYLQFAIRNAVKDKFPFKSIQYPRGPKALGWGASIDTHTVSATSKHKDEAYSLAYALADKRFAFLVGKFQGYLTGRKDNLEDLGPYAKDYFIQLQQKCTEQEDPFWRPKNLRTYEIEEALNNQLDLVWLGKREPDKSFLNDLKKTLDDILNKPA